MSDIVDRANDEADAWTAEKIRQATKHQPPNNVQDCIDCGEDIGVKRKQAMPSAVRCMKYQTQIEEAVGGKK